MTPARSYLICTSPRSGSSLLGDGLESTGVAGNPKEWFGPYPLHDDGPASAESLTADALQFRQLFHGVGSEEEYVQRIFSLGTSHNGVFGCKLHLEQIPDAKRLLRGYLGDLAATLDQAWARALPNLACIWLTRRDKVAQAISWYRAEHTGRFYKIAVDEQAHGEPDFKVEAIYGHAEKFVAQDTVWSEVFRRCGIRPLTVVYEDFAENYERVIRDVLSFLEIPHSKMAIPPARLLRQADDLSRKWHKLFLSRYPSIEQDTPEVLKPWIDALWSY